MGTEGSTHFLATPVHESRAPHSPVHVCSVEFRPPEAPRRPYPIPPVTSLRASGKGWTAGEARASCLGEAAERYSAIFRGVEPLLSARLGQLPGRCASPQALLQYSPRQYADREIWNGAFGGSQFVPEPLDPEEPLEWVAATSLRDGALCWIPAGCCFLRYAPPLPRIVFPNDSIGLAAGITREDAIVRAFLELVERDAVALWWYNRCRRPRFDIADPGEERLEAVRGYLARHGRTLHFLDLTTDLGIPVAAAVSATMRGDAILFGFAAEFDGAEAIRRAALELVQILGPPRYWSREAMLAHYRLRPDRKAWIEWASLDRQPWLLPCSKSISAVPHARVPASARLAACLRAARRADVEVFSIDLTRPDAGVPVVRVLAPGLRSSWRRLGPGRLYDVPVRLGWAEAPTPEEQLNSFPFFL